MEPKFLIVDKKQRVKIENKYPYAVTRLIEELEKKNLPYDFAYNQDIAIELNRGEISITAREKNILEYSHILFRGHFLENPRTYQIKRMIVDFIELKNKENQTNKIKIQNANAIKNIPYYNKIYTMQICANNNLPYFNSYYRLDGEYAQNTSKLDFPFIIKEYAGVNDIRMIDGERKVKKNVYKIDNLGDFEQEHLEDKNKKDFYIQEFTDQALDIRTFVARDDGELKVVGGFKREANKGFMTVRKGEYSTYNEPSEEIQKIACKFAQAVDSDFIAVDFMFKDNKPYIQEISLHPGFKAYETKTKGDKPVNIPQYMIESFYNQKG